MNANHFDTPPPKGVEFQYKNWFLYYASYVILERAIPAIEDGLKPVQRRILFAMNEMDDGRFHKVANIIGQSMQFHPHGDASIGDALVNIGQKNYLIETQGNWGDVRTGDQAAAPRYIEARLSKLAKKIAFNPKLTQWQSSYDGRKKEPITLPMKFPLLLLHGAEGIAVGLSTRILPHNFVELCTAAIHHLKGKKVELYPDFQTGGLIDVSQYKDGERGGRAKIRCHIEEVDNQTLVIRDAPFSVTTQQLIESITKANEQNKIKIKRIIDNTAEHVEIVLELAAGVTPVQTIDALYSFTKCQVSISTNACVIKDNKPQFLSVVDLLKNATDHTQSLLKQELTIAIAELEDVWHYTSLEKIFFEQQIYKQLERKELTWEKVLDQIAQDFLPYHNKLKKPVTREDINKLVEKPVRRIHKVDIDELNDKIKKTENTISEHKKNLAEITSYTIQWYEQLRSEFKTNNDRKTNIQLFYERDAREVAVKNEKLYVNRKEGFVGTGLKKDECICDCSSMDDIIAISRQGILKVVKVNEKVFIDKNILFVGIYRKNEDMAFNLIYVDGKKNMNYVKRFVVGGITRDKAYQITQGTPGSKVLYLSPTDVPEVVQITLSQNTNARIKQFEYDFGELTIGNRSVKGNQLTPYTIHKIHLDKQKSHQADTLTKTIEVYYDALFGRVNQDKNGQYVGSFEEGELLLVVSNEGYYEVLDPQEEKIVDASKVFAIQKFVPQQVRTLIYFHKKKKNYFIKRFLLEGSTKNKRFDYLADKENCEAILWTDKQNPVLRLNIGTKKDPTYIRSKTDTWVEVTSMRSMGVVVPVKERISELNWIE